MTMKIIIILFIYYLFIYLFVQAHTYVQSDKG